MTIELYVTGSDTNRVDKSLISVMSLFGSLKQSTSILDPIIIIESPTIGNVNYMYIPEFDRYYYIIDIISVANGLWELSCHVDVLMSWKSQIRATGCVLARQENARTYGNLFLDDDRFLITSRRNFSLITFPHRMTTGSDSFVLTVAGGE